jgi:hypothetical protein
MKTTDRCIAPYTYVSAQIYFGSKRRVGSSFNRSDYRARLNANARLLSMALEEFRKYLDFSKDTLIRLTSLKKASMRGTFNGTDNIASIRYRTGFKSMLETLAHELVHGEQFHTRRLSFKWSNKKCNWVAYWDGQENSLTNNHAKYLKQPWEQEAFRRQEALAAMVYLNMFNRTDEMTEIEKEVFL